MARVLRAAAASARHAHSRAVQRKPRRHKVIMESVTQEKKKLRSVISFEANAPAGYTFIPAGNPHLTTRCKERCRKDGLKVFAVTTTPHMRTHNLSQHVHRIGYHFPSTVVAAACLELGLYLTSSGKAVPFQTWGETEIRRRADSEVSQITLNTEARDILRDLFPNIPDNDLNQIIKTAFQKGQRKVGTASELPLARRAQLAVVAHIRHLYTDYDRLLKTTSFHEARTTVEEPTLAKLVEWRGDDENGRTILEDIFREVIVISDDEDSETEETAPARGARDYSVEILPSHVRAHEIQPQQVRAAKSGQDPLREFSDDEAPRGFRVVAKAPAKNTIDRRGFSRYQAWDRALNRYRAGTHATGQARLGGIPNEQRAPQCARRPTAAEAAGPGRRRDMAPQRSEIPPRFIPGHIDKQPQLVLPIPSMDRRVAEKGVSARGPFVASDSQRNSSNQSEGMATGLTFREPREVHVLHEAPRARNADFVQLQNAASLEQNHHPQSEGFLIQPNDRVDAPVFVSGPKEQLQISDPHFGRRQEHTTFHRARPVLNPQDTVLPSIENPWPSESRRVDGRIDHLTKRMSGGLSIRSVTPGRPHGEAFPQASQVDLDDTSDQTSKRRRLVYYVPPRRDTLADSWNPRPVVSTVPERIVPGEQSRRVARVPEPRSAGQEEPEETLIRRDYLPVEHPRGLGYPLDRNQNTYGDLWQANPDAKPRLERTRINHPHEVNSVSRPPGLPGYVCEGDRPFRSIPNVPTTGARSGYYGDRSPHLDRLRPAMGEARDLSWPSHVDDVSQNRRIYADDFVRHVDNREIAQPVSRRPGPEAAKQVEESLPQPSQARIPGLAGDPLAVGPRVARRPQDRGHNPSEMRALGDHEPTAQHERRTGDGLSSTRRFHESAGSSPMLEHNRPVYVQRVEPAPTAHSMPDRRHIVIVD